MDRPGPDIVNSMDPIKLKELILSEEIRKMLGGTKGAAEEEQVTIDFAFATVVSITDIKLMNKKKYGSSGQAREKSQPTLL